MWSRSPLIFLFSQSSFKSSFQIRSKLSQFFKHTHPDTNQNAPESIKEQNLRSLKNLNAYIDSLLYFKPMEAKLLKFYVSEKSNMKSKKYFAFEVELPEVKVGTTEDVNSKVLNNMIEVLNTKFLETRVMKNPLLKQELAKGKEPRGVNMNRETEEERVKRMENEIKPFRQRRQTVSEEFQHMMNEKIKSSQKNIGKEALLGELEKKVLLANTPNNKPLLWSRIAMKNAGIYSNYQETLSKIIDPSLIYLDEKLTDKQIQEFKSRLLPGEENTTPSQMQKQSQLHKLFLEMQQSSPPIFLYVSNRYSVKQIPGFLCIPYNFKPEDVVKYFAINGGELLAERTKYEHYHDTMKQSLERLKSENNMDVEFQEFMNNTDIYRKVLMTKRLSHYRLKERTLVVPFDQVEYQYFCKEYGLSEEVTCHRVGKKVVMKIEFSDSDFKDLIDREDI